MSLLASIAPAIGTDIVRNTEDGERAQYWKLDFDKEFGISVGCELFTLLGGSDG